MLFLRVTWLIHTCDMTHTGVLHDSYRCVTWLTQVCDTTPSYVWHESYRCVTWLIQVCDMTHSGVWHGSYSVWHDSYRCVTWLIQVCDMTHTGVWHDSYRRMTYVHVALAAYSLHSTAWHDVFSWVTRFIHIRLVFVRGPCLLEYSSALQSGNDAYDALNCRSLFAKKHYLLGSFAGNEPIRQDIVCMLATLCHAHAMWYTHIDCYSCGMWYIWYHVWHMMHTYWFLFLLNIMEYDAHISIAIPVAYDTYNIMCDIWCTHIKSYFCGILCDMMPTYRLLFLWHTIQPAYDKSYCICSFTIRRRYMQRECVAVRCSMLQCAAVRCSENVYLFLWHMTKPIAFAVSQHDDGICKGNVLQCAAVCCSVLQCAAVRMSTYSCGIWYSLLHLQCHFFSLKSLSLISFSRSLWPRIVVKRIMRLKLEIPIEWHSQCNLLYTNLSNFTSWECIHQSS